MSHDPICPKAKIAEPKDCYECAMIKAGRKDTAVKIERSITAYAKSMTGKREQSVALTCAALAVA